MSNTAKYLLITGLIVLTTSCKQSSNKKATNDNRIPTTFYSKAVADTFYISVHLPRDYNSQRHYPVVYLLDANLYYGIMEATLNSYTDVGLTPEIILVGVGYKDFQTMDSLRDRDYTYPAAIPEYEMTVSGGADKFLSFLNNELIPHIDKQYKTDPGKRVLMGHSLGGYLTTYALFKDLAGEGSGFSNYIAASPSINYDRFYLLNRLKETSRQNGRPVKSYITFGSLEDEEVAGDTTERKVALVLAQLKHELSAGKFPALKYKSDVYSNLGHMDTPLPTFIKGLQWALNE